jgi:hypothetical protein
MSKVRAQRHFHHRDTEDTKFEGKNESVANPLRFGGEISRRVIGVSHYY